MSESTPDVWKPDVYSRFAKERRQPFDDLLALVEESPGGRAVDLGCGTGELTRVVHAHVGAAETVGVERSAAMLGKSGPFAGGGVRFVLENIETFEPAAPLDLVFSNAALHWVADHGSLFARLASWLAPGGQLAVQMPSNHAHASHRAAADVARAEPFASALAGFVVPVHVLAPSAYAALLYRLGFAEEAVRLQVYGHRLESRDAIVDWVKGTLLTDYEARLPPELYARFVSRYRERLAELLPDERPFYFTYDRVLIWARR